MTDQILHMVAGYAIGAASQMIQSLGVVPAVFVGLAAGAAMIFVTSKIAGRV